jgi:hypothetical protein
MIPLHSVYVRFWPIVLKKSVLEVELLADLSHRGLISSCYSLE